MDKCLMKEIAKTDIIWQASSEEYDHDYDSDTAIEDEVSAPKRFKVLMHNDDYTTMEFVIHILKKYFSKTEDEAHKIMLDVHNNGFGVCGIYTFEIAETKVTKVMEEARKREFPLLCTYEPEE